MKRIALLISILLSSNSLAQAPVPQNGYVPTEKAAIAIAKIVLAAMENEKSIKSQKPFHAELKNDVWEVSGRWAPHGLILGGGGFDMRISKQTGAILGYYFKH